MGTPLNGSLLKGFAILDLFSPERTEITAAAVTAELDMNTATAHRFLTTLEQAGALTSYRRGHYCLSHRFEELGAIAGLSNQLGALAQPVIELVSRELNESVMACRLGQSGPVCIAVAPSSRPITVNIKVGTTLPLHATAQGKLWLAYLDQKERETRLKLLDLDPFSANTITDRSALEDELAAIRERGDARNRGENEPDIGAVSVPVFAREGRMVLSISAFGMLSRFDDLLTGRAAQALRNAASGIGSQLP